MEIRKRRLQKEKHERIQQIISRTKPLRTLSHISYQTRPIHCLHILLHLFNFFYIINLHAIHIQYISTVFHILPNPNVVQYWLNSQSILPNSST